MAIITENSIESIYSVASQGVMLLSSNNLVMPSDVWIASSKDIPVQKSCQYSIGYNHELSNGFDLSVEGYYKTFDNLVEYKDGASYMPESISDWKQILAIGEGRSYGIEALLQKTFGKTTGILSYTWSKSLRTFDRKGMEINGGKEFYAGSDRRNNFSVVVAHEFNEHWSASAAWCYYSGRRGTLNNVVLFGGSPAEFDAFDGGIVSGNTNSGFEISYNPDPVFGMDLYHRYSTFKNRNNYKLPDNHRLDVSVAFSLRHKRFGSSKISLSIYNLYNHMNISHVYFGKDCNKTVLKGVCMFPFMPSLNYTFKF